jgi:D-lactate dehydrogenase (cytochrome)
VPFTLRARPPVGSRVRPPIVTDPDRVGPHLEDAAHFPGGHARGVVFPASEAEVAAVLAEAGSVLPIGAQSSLTGGATPMGDLLLGTARLDRIEAIGVHRVRVQAGVTLAALDRVLEAEGRAYPAAPTFDGATVGGIVATNAAGAGTFKYGTTRDWIEALTVVLPTGDVLDAVRGATRAHPDGYFELLLPDRTVRVPVPGYHMPRLPKLSAGYFAAPGMDLVDLFVGAEGTLGVITAATLRLLPVRPATCLAMVPFSGQAAALDFVGRLRAAAREAWDSNGRRGLDVSAIEHMDARCLALLREDATARAAGVTIPADAAAILLVTLELPPGTSTAQAFDEIGRARDPAAPDTPLVRFCRLLAAEGVLDAVEIAVPGDRARARQLLAVREAVPAAVNLRVGRAKQADARIEKTAGDLVVPFERLPALLDACAAEFGRRGLDAAIWGHVSDGNVHPNVIPRSLADVEAGKDAILALGRETRRLGGAPLAEHGVGRNPVKQQLLRELYGAAGIEAMRRVKEAIDPAWRLAPGVLFPR